MIKNNITPSYKFLDILGLLLFCYQALSVDQQETRFVKQGRFEGAIPVVTLSKTKESVNQRIPSICPMTVVKHPNNASTSSPYLSNTFSITFVNFVGRFINEIYSDQDHWKPRTICFHLSHCKKQALDLSMYFYWFQIGNCRL